MFAWKPKARTPASKRPPHWRRRWLRQTLRKLPRRANLHRYPVVKYVERHLRRYPDLWSFRSASVRKALYIGLVMAWLPTMGIQAPLAIIMAFLTRSNLTVMFATQFVTNPFTAGPAYYLTYQLGDGVLSWWPGYQAPASLDEHINALIIGGVLMGLLNALLIDGLWNAMAKWFPLHKTHTPSHD